MMLLNLTGSSKHYNGKEDISISIKQFNHSMCNAIMFKRSILHGNNINTLYAIAMQCNVFSFKILLKCKIAYWKAIYVCRRALWWRGV